MIEVCHLRKRTTGSSRTVVRRPLVSIVTPAFNEQDSLPLLYERLCRTFNGCDVDWQWLVVDDHSSDGTAGVLAALAERDARVRGVRLSRNFGSHAALCCGLRQAQGHCAIVLAADLQDPPEIIPELLAAWTAGAQVVWAARRRRPGTAWSARLLARTYYAVMRHVVGLRGIPASGADSFLIDRAVLRVVNRLDEKNVALFPLISWVGFEQRTISYDKQPRQHGESGWTLRKKLKLMVDSVASFTYLPIRLMSLVGFCVAGLGFVFACYVVVEALLGSPVMGYPSLMVVLLVLGGLQMVMLGVLGEYIWRALDEVRGRPRYVIERRYGAVAAPAARSLTLAAEPDIHVVR